MEKKEFVCISCPVGCQLTAWQDENGETKIAGNACARGKTYGAQEFKDPRRVVTSSVLVSGGHMPVVSCRTDGTVSKRDIPAVLRAIRQARRQAPVEIGDVLVENAAGTGVNVIATREVRRDIPPVSPD